MILVIDHNDSFIYTLNLYCLEAGYQTNVLAYDHMYPTELDLSPYQAILLSPGPCHPKDFPKSHQLIARCADQNMPILGVCLGHQLLAHCFSAQIDKAVQPLHGQSRPSFLTEMAQHSDPIFANCPAQFETMRYHSLAVTKLSPQITPLAWSSEQDLMAFKIQDLPFWGVQFHPESVGTDLGRQILGNFLDFTAESERS